MPSNGILNQTRTLPQPPSACNIFSQKIRSELEGRDLSFSEMARLAGEKWRSPPPWERESYMRPSGCTGHLVRDMLTSGEAPNPLPPSRSAPGSIYCPSFMAAVTPPPTLEPTIDRNFPIPSLYSQVESRTSTSKSNI
jgi:hypothetical protein